MKKSLLTSLTTAAITLALTLTGCASTNTQTACYSPITHEEIYQILKECL